MVRRSKTVVIYPRLAEQRINDAMSDTRVVLIVGPRQSAKTTLAKKMASAEMEYYTLDNATTLEAAQRDPVGFVRGMSRAIIDEMNALPNCCWQSRKAWIPTNVRDVFS